MEGDRSHQCDSPLPPERSAASNSINEIQLLQPATCGGGRSGNKRHTCSRTLALSQVRGERRVIIVQLFPLRSSGGSWPITIVIMKSSSLQVRDIKDDNVFIIFKVPAAPPPPRVPVAATLMRASQDGGQRLLRTQNAITPNPPLLIGRQKADRGP